MSKKETLEKAFLEPESPQAYHTRNGQFAADMKKASIAAVPGGNDSLPTLHHKELYN